MNINCHCKRITRLDSPQIPFDAKGNIAMIKISDENGLKKGYDSLIMLCKINDNF